jgi:hypothetical protein
MSETPAQLLKPATDAVRALGLRCLVFGGADNPCNFDSPRHPKRTVGLSYMLGRSRLGARPWLWVEYDEADEPTHTAVLEIGRTHHVEFCSFAAPFTERLAKLYPHHVRP